MVIMLFILFDILINNKLFLLINVLKEKGKYSVYII